MVLNPKRIEVRKGFCKERFTSARASMQFHRFKPGLSHPQPGLNEVVSGTKGPPWLRPGLNFFLYCRAECRPHPELAGGLAKALADPVA